jgi:hypothetical protein
MKGIILSILILVTTNCFAQNWIEYRIDSTVTLTLPEQYRVVDTMRQHMIISPIENGMVMLTMIDISDDSSVNVRNEAELLRSYDDFQRGVINSSPGTLIEEDVIEKSGLKLKQFSFRVVAPDGVQTRYCEVVLVNHKIYGLFFWELESMSDQMREAREKLFSSWVFPTGLTLEDQMSFYQEDTVLFKAGHFIGYNLGVLLIVGGVTAVIVLIVRIIRR